MTLKVTDNQTVGYLSDSWTFCSVIIWYVDTRAMV